MLLFSSSSSFKDLLMIIIPSVLIVGALSLTALIIWLRYHRSTQSESRLPYGLILYNCAVSYQNQKTYQIFNPENVLFLVFF